MHISRRTWYIAIASLAGFVVIGALVALLASALKEPNHDRANVFMHKGIAYCGYIVEGTRQAQCGKSGVPRDRWVMPTNDETFDTRDGVDVTDHAVAHMTCNSTFQWLPESLKNDARLTWHSWLNHNMGICKTYSAWQSTPISTPEPKPTQSPSKSARPKAPSPSRSR